MHHVHRQSASGQAHGWGLAIVHRKELTVRSRNSKQTFLTFEIQVVNIRSGSSDIVVANIYRPPSSPIGQFLIELADFLTTVGLSAGDGFLACGDFNCPELSNNTINDDLSSIFDVHGMVQCMFLRQPDATRLRVEKIFSNSSCIQEQLDPSNVYSCRTYKLSVPTICPIMNSSSAPSRSSGPSHHEPIIDIVTPKASTSPSCRHVSENPRFSQLQRKLPIFLLIK